MKTDKDEPSTQGGDVGSLGVGHLKEFHEPPTTRSYSVCDSSGFNEAYFYQYLRLSHLPLNLRPNAIYEHQ